MAENAWHKMAPVLAGGATGGVLGWAFALWDRQPPHLGVWADVAVSVPLGAGAGFIFVFLIANTDRSDVYRLIGLALVAGFFFEPVWNGARLLVDQRRERQVEERTSEYIQQARREIEEAMASGNPVDSAELRNLISAAAESAGRLTDVANIRQVQGRVDELRASLVQAGMHDQIMPLLAAVGINETPGSDAEIERLRGELSERDARLAQTENRASDAMRSLSEVTATLNDTTALVANLRNRETELESRLAESLVRQQELDRQHEARLVALQERLASSDAGLAAAQARASQLSTENSRLERLAQYPGMSGLWIADAGASRGTGGVGARGGRGGRGGATTAEVPDRYMANWDVPDVRYSWTSSKLPLTSLGDIDITSALVVGETVEVPATARTPQVWLELTLEEAARLDIRFTGAERNDLVAAIYETDTGAAIDVNDDSDGLNPRLQLDLDAGRYLIAVSDYGGEYVERFSVATRVQ